MIAFLAWCGAMLIASTVVGVTSGILRATAGDAVTLDVFRMLVAVGLTAGVYRAATGRWWLS